MQKVADDFGANFEHYKVSPVIGLPRPWRFLARPDLFFLQGVATATPFGPDRRQVGCEFHQHPGSLMKYAG
jgi:hypothetical protein